MGRSKAARNLKEVTLPNNLLLRTLGAVMVLAAAPAVMAHTCRVGIKDPVFVAGSSPAFPPTWRTPAEHRAMFQFRVQLDGVDASPAAFEWAIVAKDGVTPLQDAGSILDGLYTPPAGSASKSRTVKVRVALKGNSDVHATTSLIIRAHGAMAIAGRELGPQWRGTRVEAVWQPKPGRTWDAAAEKYKVGKIFPAPPLHEPKDLAWAPPFQLGDRVLEDRLVVLDSDRLLAVEATGRTELLANLHETKGGEDWMKFRRLAFRPAGVGKPGPLEGFLVDGYTRMMHLTPEGTLEPLPYVQPESTEGNKDLSFQVRDVAVNAGGQVFVALLAYVNNNHYGTKHYCSLIRKWDPQKGWSTLAGSLPAQSDDMVQALKDGTGPEASLGFVDCLALDAASGKLWFGDLEYGLSIEPPKVRLRGLDLASGAVTTLVEPKHFLAERYTEITRHSLSLYQGRLLALDGNGVGFTGVPSRLLSMDPTTGQLDVLYQDVDKGELQAGPCTTDVPARKRGRLGGSIFQFAVGDHGQVAFLYYSRLGLLVLDGPALGASERKQEGAGASATEERKVERKDESKAQ